MMSKESLVSFILRNTRIFCKNRFPEYLGNGIELSGNTPHPSVPASVDDPNADPRMGWRARRARPRLPETDDDYDYYDDCRPDM